MKDNWLKDFEEFNKSKTLREMIEGNEKVKAKIEKLEEEGLFITAKVFDKEIEKILDNKYYINIMKVNDDSYNQIVKEGNKYLYAELCSIMNDERYFLNDYRNLYSDNIFKSEDYCIRRNALKLKSGKLFSVQASSYHYCKPRISVSFEVYEKVELGIFESFNACDNDVLKNCEWEDRESEDACVYVLPCISIVDLVRAIAVEGGIESVVIPK